MEATASLVEFAEELSRIVIKSPDDSNVLVSPIALSTSLAMLLNGTRNNSSIQLRKVLRLPPWMKQDEINYFYDSLMNTYNWERSSSQTETSSPESGREFTSESNDLVNFEDGPSGSDRSREKVLQDVKPPKKLSSFKWKKDAIKPVKRNTNHLKKLEGTRGKKGLLYRLLKLIPDRKRVISAKVTQYTQLEALSSLNIAGSNLKIDTQLELKTRVNNKGRQILINNLTLISKLYDVLPDFADVIFEKYKSIVSQVDFLWEPDQMMNEVNEWIFQSTKGQISNFNLNKMSDLVILNCVYFNTLWEEPFGIPYGDEFYVKENQTKDATFMNVLKVLKYLQIALEVPENFLQLIEIPFVGSLSMIVLLPPKELTIETFVGEMSVQQLLTQFRASGYFRSVHLRMPKFTIGLEKNMSGVFKKMHLSDIFDSQLADLTGLTSSPDVHVSEIKHIAVINVNEAGVGTETPTFNQESFTCGSFEPLELAIDHPFIFLIYDSCSNVPVFIGKIQDPTVSI